MTQDSIKPIPSIIRTMPATLCNFNTDIPVTFSDIRNLVNVTIERYGYADAVTMPVASLTSSGNGILFKLSSQEIKMKATNNALNFEYSGSSFPAIYVTINELVL